MNSSAVNVFMYYWFLPPAISQGVNEWWVILIWHHVGESRGEWEAGGYWESLTDSLPVAPISNSFSSHLFPIHFQYDPCSNIPSNTQVSDLETWRPCYRSLHNRWPQEVVTYDNNVLLSLWSSRLPGLSWVLAGLSPALAVIWRLDWAGWPGWVLTRLSSGSSGLSPWAPPCGLSM